MKEQKKMASRKEDATPLKGPTFRLLMATKAKFKNRTI
jgi:hypothetical protein